MTPTSVAGIDLYDPDQYVIGVPHEAFARLRREAPVSWTEEPAGRGFWSVVKHADVQMINREWERFGSTQGTSIPDWSEEQRASTSRSMLYMDPTKHTRYRLLVNKGFTPRMISKLKESIVLAAKTIVDNVIERGECDLVVDVAAELPLQAIADIMGVPPEDRHKLLHWSNQLIGSQDPEFALNPDELRQAQKDIYAYANALALDKQHHPADDVISTLVHAEIEWEGSKQKLTELEFDQFFVLLMTAGVETTRNLISHGMLAFFERPDQWQELLANRELLDSAVEEMLRWSTPVMHFRRTAATDQELRGQQIKAGDKVVLWYVSANNDEEVFADPLSFDITRTPNDHVTFGGGGPHYCLGANLARVEAKAMFDELMRRIPDMRQAGPPKRLRANNINGIKRLPVTFEPRAVAPGA